MATIVEGAGEIIWQRLLSKGQAGVEAAIIVGGIADVHGPERWMGTPYRGCGILGEAVHSNIFYQNFSLAVGDGDQVNDQPIGVTGNERLETALTWSSSPP